MERTHPACGTRVPSRRDSHVSVNSKSRQDAGDPHAGCLRSHDACAPYAPVADAFIANSPFSFMISRVISADAYMSFTSSHSFTV